MSGTDENSSDDTYGGADRDNDKPDDSRLRRVGTYGRDAERAGDKSQRSVKQGGYPLNPPGSRPNSAVRAPESESDLGTLAGIIAAIGLMLLAGYVFRSEPLTPAQAAQLPAIANSRFTGCPQGEVPRSLIRPAETLEHGPIIDDTQ
jgi:hypothetical protein